MNNKNYLVSNLPMQCVQVSDGVWIQVQFSGCDRPAGVGLAPSLMLTHSARYNFCCYQTQS